MQNRLLMGIAVLFTMGVYGPIGAQSVTAVLVILMWLVLPNKKLKDIRISPLWWPSVMLGIACAWSLVWASISNLTFLGMHPEIQWIQDLRKLWHLFFPFCFLGVLLNLERNQFRKILWLWFGCGFLSALLGVFQHYYPVFKPLPLPDVGLRGYFHATGLTGFHLSYIGIIAFPTGVAVALLAILTRRKKFSNWRFWGAVFATLSFFCAGVFAYSKIHWIALPLTVMMLALLGFRGWPRYLVITAVLAFGIFWATSPQVALRFRGTDSIKERVEVWQANWEMVKQFPLFGVGWHHNSELSYAYYAKIGIQGFASHAHNNFLDQLSSTGLFGLIGFVWWNIMVFLMSFRLYARNHQLLYRAFGLGLLGGWICLHLNGMTQSNFWDAKILHQIGWVSAVLMALNAHKNRV